MTAAEASVRQRWRDAIRYCEDPAIDTEARAVAFALDLRMSHEGRTYSGVRFLAARSALHTRTVIDRIKRLERAGWLKVIRPTGPGGRNEYQATFPGPSAPVGRPRKVRAPNAHSFGGTNRGTARSQSESARSRSNGQRKVRAPSTESARPERADPGRSRQGDPGGPGATGNARPDGRSPGAAQPTTRTSRPVARCSQCGSTDHRTGECPKRLARRQAAR